jgi:hypothetical protein
MVVFVPSLGMGAMVGAHTALGLDRGPYASLGLGKSMPTGSGILVIMLQGSGEVEIVPDRVQGSGTLMTSWGWPHPRPYSGAQVRREPALSLGQLNSYHAINAFGWVCLISIPDSSPRACGGVWHSLRGLSMIGHCLRDMGYVVSLIWEKSSGGCARAHPLGVVPEALEG